MLTEGRFVASEGFDILEEGAIAVPDTKTTATDGVLTLSLTWADEGCVVKL